MLRGLPFTWRNEAIPLLVALWEKKLKLYGTVYHICLELAVPLPISKSSNNNTITRDVQIEEKNFLEAFDNEKKILLFFSLFVTFK